MPSNRPATIRTDTLPEFLRSKTVGAVVAEALDAATDTTSPGALSDLITGAAREIREFHGLPEPDQHAARVREIRDETRTEWNAEVGQG